MSRIEDAIERYEALVEEKDSKIDELERKLEEVEWWANERSWSRHRDEEESDLPVPRLQIKLTKESESKYRWFYSLVYRHAMGSLSSVPMGETVSTGRHSFFKFETVEDAHREIPYRDGVHIRRDAAQLKLPAYAVFQGKAIQLEPIEPETK